MVEGTLVSSLVTPRLLHFDYLSSSPDEGAKLAIDYLKASKAIGEQLVADGVANNPEDVNGVLTNGFFHLYGPINDYAA